ncbi:MAG TPA: LacI family DNA-binding transcriptional regulator [Chloroflexota bacterium]|jgi:DNA-binding LacI/PurR family transcriptional regulator|nr:LacI family DNA-binding transcriptional regulator [Chloroflexota bacterium]
MAVKLKDVAAHAGVSAQTVSNVIRGKHARVGDDTRRQVLAAIEALGYRPNAAARSLRQARIGLIALAIPDLVNPYYADLGHTIVAEAAAYGYTVLLDHTRFDRTSEFQIISGLGSPAIDGVILDLQLLEQMDLQAQPPRMPLVLLGEHLLDAPYDHVAIDNVAAAHGATRHLLGMRRRRIAAIGVDRRKADGAAMLRLRGFLQALEEAGQAADPALLLHCDEWHRTGGAQAMRRLLALAEPPDAVFCFNDLLAIGAMRALHEAGYRIPHDVAVVGFDDIEEGHFATPSLTTISPAKAEIGRLAVELLMSRIDGSRNGPPERIEPQFTLRVRESTGPIQDIVTAERETVRNRER